MPIRYPEVKKNIKGITMTFSIDDIQNIYQRPMNALLFDAHSVHRQHHDPNAIERAALLSIKTGACPEDCGYCSQSGHHKTQIEKENLMSIADVLTCAREAQQEGATRFCMGAAWRSPPEKAMPVLCDMVREVKALGLETCMCLGMLDEKQAKSLKEAGLDFYNHNIDTSPEYYGKVITTRSFEDRLNTLSRVQEAGMKVCCGGILGLGESEADRWSFLAVLANMTPQPESVPINQLIPVKGTPLAHNTPLDGFELVRTIATARILIPKAVIRLSAGRTEMSDYLQALCFFAGANSVFIGGKLLTEPNPEVSQDAALFASLGTDIALPA